MNDSVSSSRNISWRQFFTTTNKVLIAGFALGAGFFSFRNDVREVLKPEFSVALVGEKLVTNELTIIVAAPGSKGGSLRSAMIVVPFIAEGKNLKLVTMFFPKAPVFVSPGTRQQIDLPWMQISTHIQGNGVDPRHPSAKEVELLGPLVKDLGKRDCEFGVDLVSEDGKEPIPQHLFGCGKVSGILNEALKSSPLSTSIE